MGDLLVLPSHFKGLPRVVLEAMALGLPVAASRIGGAVEALGRDHPFFVPPGDPEPLADGIAAALAGPLGELAAAQRRRFAARFTAARMTSETAALCRSTLRRRPLSGGWTGMGKLRMGFAGAGAIAHRHFRVLETFDDVEIASVADPDSARARAVAERTGARAFAD